MNWAKNNNKAYNPLCITLQRGFDFIIIVYETPYRDVEDAVPYVGKVKRRGC